MVFRYAFTLSKTGPMAYLSHLDLMRLLARACRRAGLSLALSQGFSPRPRLRLKRAVKLGVPFEAETGEMVLKDLVAPQELEDRLRRALPQGISVTNIAMLEQK